MKTLLTAAILALCAASGIAVVQSPQVAETVKTWAGGPR